MNMENSQNELELCIDNEMVIDISVLFKTEEEWMEIWLNELTASPKLMVGVRTRNSLSLKNSQPSTGIEPSQRELSNVYQDRWLFQITCITLGVIFVKHMSMRTHQWMKNGRIQNVRHLIWNVDTALVVRDVFTGPHLYIR